MRRRSFLTRSMLLAAMLSAWVSGVVAKPLEVVSVTPGGEELGEVSQIVLTFNQPMVVGGGGMVNAHVPEVTIAPAPPCRWRWLDAKRLACELPEEGGIELATRYTVTVNKGIQALGGDHLEEAFEATFATARPALEETSVDFEEPGLPVVRLSTYHRFSKRTLEGNLWFKDDRGHKYAVTAAFADQWDYDRTRYVWRIAPVEAIAGSGRDYQLIAGRGLVSKDGPLVLGKARVLASGRTYSEFEVLGIRCATDVSQFEDADELPYYQPDGPPCLPNSAALMFSAPVHPARTYPHVTIEPGPDDRTFDVTHYDADSEFVRLPLVNGGTDYTTDVPAGSLKDVFGRPLKKAFSQTVTTGDVPRRFRIGRSNTVLEKTQSSDLQVVTTNVDQLTVDAEVLGSVDDPGWRPLEYELEVPSGHANQDAHFPAGLRARLNVQSAMVSGSLKADSLEPTDFRVQFTPFSLYTKATRRGILVWVARLADATPVADTSVRVVSVEDSGWHKQLGRAPDFLTDASGVALIRYKQLRDLKSPNKGEAKRIFVVANKAGDFAVARVYFGSLMDRLENISERARRPRIAVSTLTSAMLYRPGERVDFKLVARQSTPAGQKAVSGGDYRLSVRYRWEDEDDEHFQRQTVSFDEFGGYSGHFQLPDDVPSGNYQLILHRDGAEYAVGSFSVERFNMPTLDMQLSLDGNRIVAGEPVNAAVQAAFYNGTPFGNAEVRIHAETSGDRQWLLENPYPDFTFKPVASDSTHSGTPLFDLQGQTDAGGRFQTSVVPNEQAVYFGNARITFAANDPRGRRQQGSRMVPYVGRDRIAGLRTSIHLEGEGVVGRVDALVLDASREKVAGAPVEVVFERAKDWSRYGTSSEDTWREVHRCVLQSAMEPVSCTAPLEFNSRYRFSATTVDTKGRTHTSYETDRVSTPPLTRHGLTEAKEEVTLSVPDEAVAGEAFEIRIDNPFEKARVFFVLESAGMLDYRVEQLEAGQNTVTWRLPAEVAPGYVDIRAVLLKPRNGHRVEMTHPVDADPYRPRVVVERAQLHLLPGREEIALSVEPGKPAYRPGAEVELNVSAGGASPGEELELALTVIDQALLDMIRDLPYYSLSDVPSDRFFNIGAMNQYGIRDLDFGFYGGESSFRSSLTGYCYRGNSLPTFESFLDLDFNSYWSNCGRGAGRMMAMMKSRASNAERRSDALRRDFRSVAYWNPSIRMRSGTTQTVRFKLPDNLTEWVVLANVMDKGGGFGFSRASIATNKPTEVRAALPNTLVKGDRADGRFSISNQAGTTRRLDYRFSAAGAVRLAEEHNQEGRLELDPGERADVDIAMEADHAGEARLDFKVGDAHDEDGVRKTLVVRNDRVPERFALSGKLPPGTEKTVPLALPDGSMPGEAEWRLELRLQSMAMLTEAFRFGRDYPYTCWEQQLSRAVLAALYSNAPEAVRDKVTWPGAATLIETTLSSLEKYQLNSGGMRFFSSDGGAADLALSAYTLRALDWLKTLGYPAPGNVQNRLIDYFAALPDEAYSRQTAHLLPAFPVLMANSRIASRLVGQRYAKGGVLTELLARLAVHGDRAVLEQLKAVVEREGYADSDATMLQSGLARQCMLVSALAGSRAEMSERLTGGVRRFLLTGAGKGSTQENAYCAMAFYDLLQTRPVSSAAQAEFTAALEGDTLERGRLDASSPMFALSRPWNTDKTMLNLSVTGNSPVYYRAAMQYSRPVSDAEPVANGLHLKRAYFRRSDEDKWMPVKSDDTLQRGDVVRVELTLEAPTARNMVVVSDPLPGNLEAWNPDLGDTAMQWHKDGPSGRGHYFYHREYGLDGVDFYAERLPEGHYTLDYYAQVVAAGEFTALPVHAEAMYDREIYATTEHDTLSSK